MHRDLADIHSGVDKACRSHHTLVAKPQVRAAVAGLDVGEIVLIFLFEQDFVVGNQQLQ